MPRLLRMRRLRLPLSLGFFLAISGLVGSGPATLVAQDSRPATLFSDVRVFDGTSAVLLGPTNVLVEGNRITRIGPEVTAPAGARIIEGGARTLMPGLIDVHVHMTFGALTMADLLDQGMTPERLAQQVAAGAEAMLMRGFTSVRDVGGPIFELKAAIDAGQVRGPRIWPSGATISQTSGHGDFRTPNERSRRFFGEPARAELLGATFIADGVDEVLHATRENLRFGASQIKLMAGGGTSSDYDPLDVTQYTLEEMRAAVQAAEDWGTYVAVHAYTPAAVRRAMDAGVRVIEHGQLLDEATLRLMKLRGVWLSTQVLMDNTPDMTPLRIEKRRPVLEGQRRLWPLAREIGVKLAWGTDFLFEPELNVDQNQYILRLAEWFTPAEILTLVTHDNAQLLALSGLRAPYQGRLGVVREGALADLLLVDGDPLADLSLLGDPERRFVIIMKDGQIMKDLVSR